MISLEKSHPKPSWVVGFTSRYNLMLDIDDTTLYKAEWLTKLIMKRYNKVGDCLIILSSLGDKRKTLKYTSTKRPYLTFGRPSYHLVYDNKIGYNLCVKIIESIANLGIIESSFIFMRNFRGDITLRVSPTIQSGNIKPIPKPVKFILNPYCKRHDLCIWEYLNLLCICHSLFSPLKDTKSITNNSSNTPNNNTKHSTINIIH